MAKNGMRICTGINHLYIFLISLLTGFLKERFNVKYHYTSEFEFLLDICIKIEPVLYIVNVLDGCVLIYVFMYVWRPSTQPHYLHVYFRCNMCFVGVLFVSSDGAVSENWYFYMFYMFYMHAWSIFNCSSVCCHSCSMVEVPSIVVPIGYIRIHILYIPEAASVWLCTLQDLSNSVILEDCLLSEIDWHLACEMNNGNHRSRTVNLMKFIQNI